VRIFNRLDELYAIGGGPGANRIGYSAEEDAAHELAEGWLREAGLEVEVDESGNLIGRLVGEDPELPQVWTGSHLDSVPHGGRYDGALGVVAAIEALERLGRRPRSLAVVAFRDEERGCAGSRGRCAGGELPGTRTVEGRAGHAGTTPMLGRQDALVAAAEEIVRIRDAALAVKDTVATVGQLEVEPGSTNVIPSRVTFSVDARAPDAERLSRLIAAVGLEDEGRTEPVAMSERVQAVLRDAVAARDLLVVELPSGAGHDAGILAAAGVDAGMLFVRAGADGVSHAPDEAASDEDVTLSVDVLTDALERLSAR
jgi:acetylornithine deacetylase/succinyl-diaminopimelate desuccinylase-like protein